MNKDQIIMGEPPKEEVRKSRKIFPIIFMLILAFLVVGLMFFVRGKNAKAPSTQIADLQEKTADLNRKELKTAESTVTNQEEPQPKGKDGTLDSSARQPSASKEVSESADKVTVPKPQSIEQAIPTDGRDIKSGKDRTEDEVEEQKVVETSPKEVVEPAPKEEVANTQIEASAAQEPKELQTDKMMEILGPQEGTQKTSTPDNESETEETSPVIATVDSSSDKNAIGETKSESKTLQNIDGATSTQSGKPKEWYVNKGDTLWNIAKNPQIFGDPFKWHLIYQANKEIIDNPDWIYPGQKFIIPNN